MPSAALAVLVVALTVFRALSPASDLPAPARDRACPAHRQRRRAAPLSVLLGFGPGGLLNRPALGSLRTAAGDAVGHPGCFLLSTLVLRVRGIARHCWWARLVRALGACAGPVLGRAVVRDLYGPPESARVLSHVSTATALSPLLATPLFGGWLTAAWGARPSRSIAMV